MAADANWDPGNLNHENASTCFISILHCVSFPAALTKLVNSLKETDSLSSEQELGFLQSLLESKELNALVNVHSKVAKVCKNDRLLPVMSTSLQVRRDSFGASVSNRGFEECFSGV